MQCAECRSEHEPDFLCPVDVRSCEETVGAREAGGLPPPLVAPGQMLGSFRLERRIGGGAMGSVFLARHSVIGSKVAVKVLKPELTSQREQVERFFSEARAVNLVGHEHIVKIFDMNAVPPRLYYFLMEYLEGRPLSSFPVPLPAAVAIPILAQICEALEAAHRAGVVHLDVKPDNVFLTRRKGRTHQVKVLDFGAARFLSASAAARPKLVVGTPAFMAPEQFLGGEVDGRSDIYALGASAYLLATGRLPFELGNSQAMSRAHREQQPREPRELNPTIPRAFSQAILTAMAKRREDRFESAAELGRAFRAVLRRRRGAVLSAAHALSGALEQPARAPRYVCPGRVKGKQDAQTLGAESCPLTAMAQPATCLSASVPSGLELATISWRNG